MIVPVILAGGSGSRLWPLSRSAYPKQLLPLVSDKTMLQETLLRAQALETSGPPIDIGPPIVICNEEYRFIVAEQLRAIGIEDATIILEPEGKNTAPAAALAALLKQKDNPLLLILPADHFIRESIRFTAAVYQAMIHAETGHLLTFGITPHQPETGYGYIKISPNTDYDPVYKVEQFVEKPDLETAKKYLSSKDYYWNSGIFLFKASTYLAELKCHAPLILQSCQKALALAKQDADFIRLDQTSFAACDNISIDYAIMEKTINAMLIRLDAGWSDIGSWSALCDTQDANEEGNILQGDVVLHEVKNSYVRAESRMLAVVGMSDAIVVETPDVVLVAHKEKSQAIKHIVTKLKEQKRHETELHQLVYRPWGTYEILYESKNFKVKYITIKPKASLSLQLHHHRSEHWVVVNGTAEVTRDEEIFLVNENQSTYIPQLTKHRLANPTDTKLEIIEVQLGNCLSEDDIVRFEDLYGRAQTI